ncbi:MAG TPA: hypothetical protein VFE32_13910 [Puia sp.]|jgi:hypothetical protein|nr:hypothetical protein [Puia sp.]
MERLKELISQLKEQFDHKAEPSQMLQTTRLLEAELRILATQPAPGRVMPTKIAVMMPSAAKIPPSPPQPAPAPAESAAKSAVPAAPAAAPVAAANGAPAIAATNSAPAIAAINGTPAINGAPATNGAPVANGTAVATAAPARNKEPERGVWPFDPLAEKPTDRFTLSQKSREINDIIGGGAGSSLNEKLKPDIVDLRSALNDTPVRDLKKAIGINDRYVFVNQLFRGDEAMYERSIKTINAFRILPEAEYWMERELKVKLGWDENRDVTRHFYQLVKRRFS